MKGGESCLDTVGRKASVRARKHGPKGQKSRRWSAAGRVRQPRRTPRPQSAELWCATRRSIPLGLVGGTKGTTAYPAPQRIRVIALGLFGANRASPARAGCLTIESVNERAGANCLMVIICLDLSAVIAGLDPAIHEAAQQCWQYDLLAASHHGCPGQARA
jgi:hypothetical protein